MSDINTNDPSVQPMPAPPPDPVPAPPPVTDQQAMLDAEADAFLDKLEAEAENVKAEYMIARTPTWMQPKLAERLPEHPLNEVPTVPPTHT
jgi:hypothetical protein